MEEDEAFNFIRKVMAESFKENNEVISTMDSKNENPVERALELGNLHWKKAEGRIPKRTATGLDRIPKKLINELSPASQAALLRAIENRLQDR